MELPRNRNFGLDRNFYSRRALVAATLAPLALTACSEFAPAPHETEPSSEIATFNEQGSRIASALANYLNKNGSAIARNTDGTWKLVTGETPTVAYAIFNKDVNELTLGASTPTDTDKTYSWVSVTLTPNAQMAVELRAAERSKSAPDTHVFTNPIMATGDNGPIVKSFTGTADGRIEEKTGAYFLAVKDTNNPQQVYAIATDSSSAPTTKQPSIPYDKATASQISKSIDQALRQTVG